MTVHTSLRVLALVAAACLTGTVVTPSRDAVGSGPPTSATAHFVQRSTARAVITVKARQPKRPVTARLIGVNHRFEKSAHGTWGKTGNQPVPSVVQKLQQAGVSIVRFPGGKVANLYDWKQAIGNHRGCQINGRLVPGRGYFPVPEGRVYGPDEHMTSVNAVGAQAEIMVPFATETPADAADWVEYMNTPSHVPANPHGGVDWADRRASNGHPAPYHVRLWEVGNEQRFRFQRYWMSHDRHIAIKQYVHGGSRRVREAMGSKCRHPKVGVPSTGEPFQEYEAIFPPVARHSFKLTVSGHQWTRVSDFSTAGRHDHVFTLRPKTGQVMFGDGVHGAIPPRGVTVRARYRSVHPGVFSFIRAMKQVDPSIEVCPSWGTSRFAHVATGHNYDCMTAHPYTHFQGDRHNHWSGPLEGHDWHMLGTATEFRFIRAIKRSLPRGTPVALSEFGVINGNNRQYPHWNRSMTHALYMSSQWVHWINLGIPWALGNDMVAPDGRGLLGPAVNFVFSAEAVTREAIKPMFEARGRALPVDVTGNPRRNPGLGAGTYPALVVAASKDSSQGLYLLVVNRLPHQGQAVKTIVRLGSFRADGRALFRQVTSPTFRSFNKKASHPVKVRVFRQQIGTHSLLTTFPAHSVTLIHVRHR